MGAYTVCMIKTSVQSSVPDQLTTIIVWALEHQKQMDWYYYDNTVDESMTKYMFIVV
jgi:hypothetical protein